MDERSEEPKPPKVRNNLQLSVADINLDEIKRDPTSFHVSPRGPSGTNNTIKPSSARLNCLCSPTTHAGSFRCRLHRASGGMTRGGSVGSNLSMLGATKSDDFFESDH